MTLIDVVLLTSLFTSLGFWMINRKYINPSWHFGAASVAFFVAILVFFQHHWQALPAGIIALFSLCLLILTRKHKKNYVGSFPKTSATGLIFLSLAAISPYYFFPVFSLPAPSGEYSVGVQDLELADPFRSGVLMEDEGFARRIKVKIWYPTVKGTKTKRTRYWNKDIAYKKGRSLGENFGYPKFIYTHFGSIKTHSHLDAPIAPPPEPFPLIVFNHGFWSYLEQNTALMEMLASNGYVVASISHVRDSARVDFKDGGFVMPYYYEADDKKLNHLDEQLSTGLEKFMGEETHALRTKAIDELEKAVLQHRIYESYQAWLADTFFVVNALKSGDVPGATREVTESIDFETIGSVGMSFGGTMAASYCHRELKCLAAVNMDGENFDFELYDKDIQSALLILLTDQPFNSFQFDDPSFNPTDYAYEEWAKSGEREDIYRYKFNGIRHLGLTDLHLSARSPFRNKMYGDVARKRGLLIQNEAILIFLNAHLDKSYKGNISTELSSYPELTLHDPESLKNWARDNFVEELHK